MSPLCIELWASRKDAAAPSFPCSKVKESSYVTSEKKGRDSVNTAGREELDGKVPERPVGTPAHGD